MNSSIDNEIDDVCEPWRTGYSFSVSAGKTKFKHFNLGSTTDFSLVYPFLVIMAFRDVPGVGGGQKTPIAPGTFLCQNHPTKSDVTSG